jgi:hypothetical protein
LAGHPLPVFAITYGTVMVQVAFPFLVFNRRIKNVLLVMMIIEHAAIAVTLGLPFFSLAMISADAVFLPTGFLVRAGESVVRRATLAQTSLARRTQVARSSKGVTTV